MLESKFQRDHIARLRREFPGIVILKVEPGYIQGIPDRFALLEDKWAALEFKRDRNAIIQPNQRYYVDLLDRMSFASFVYPENEEETLRGLQQTFYPSRSTRVS